MTVEGVAAAPGASTSPMTTSASGCVPCVAP